MNDDKCEKGTPKEKKKKACMDRVAMPKTLSCALLVHVRFEVGNALCAFQYNSNG